MTLADRLTWGRVLLTPIIVWLWTGTGSTERSVGLALFLVAGITDYLDGRVARAAGQSSRVGSYLDPLADKVLVLGAALALVEVHRLSLWIALILLIRELAVTGLRSILPPGEEMPASYWAKWKTTVQMAALAVSLLWTGLLPDGLWVLAVGLTVFTGWEYFWKHWPKNP